MIQFAMRALLIEDDQTFAGTVARGLQEEFIDVDIAATGDAGGELARARDYDIIVLDWCLPDRDGPSVCRALRASQIGTPVLMLSARETPEDRLAGFNAGADDYLSKTAGFEQLLGRIHALLRRVTVSRPTLLSVADLTLDLVSRRVMRDNRVIDLTPKEFAILAVLMRHPGGVLTRTKLTESVWEGEADFDNVIDVHVGHLRKKLDCAGAVPLIRTVRGSGYMIRHPVERQRLT